jgi:hypothetical protein
MEEKLAPSTCTKCGEILDPVKDLDCDRPAYIGFYVDCDTCGLPQRLCVHCWNNTDDCNECEEQRGREQWCPMCDTPCVNLTPEEKKSHGHHCTALPLRDR